MATAPQTAMDMPQEGMNPYANPDTAAIYDQMRQSVSPKEFSDEVLAGASQVDPEEVAKFKAELEQLEVPMEVLDMLNNMVDEILANPDNYEQVKQKYEAMGVTDDLLPPQFDGEFFSALNMAVDQMIAEPAGAQAFAKGGIAELSPISKAVADYGRNGDTMLAHITPAEARMLRRRGGAGTTNPKTGLKEYFSLGKLFKSIGNAVKSFAKSTVGKIVLTVALGFFLGPAAASLVGATSAAGVAAVSGFVGSAGSTLLAGGNLKDALKAGAVGGLTAGAIGGVTQGFDAAYTGPTTVGGQVDKFTNMISPSAAPTATPSGIQAPSVSPTGQVAGMAPVETINPLERQYATPAEIARVEGMNPANASDSTLARQQLFSNPTQAPASFTETPVNANEQVFRPPVAATANPMDATEFQGSLAKPQGVAPPTDPSFLDKAKTFYNENISPSGIQQQGMPVAEQAGKAAQDALLARTPSATPAMLESAYQTAYKAAMPGIVSTYGPMAAVGIGALGAAGGFKPTSAAPSTLRPELMKPVTQRIAEGGNQRNYYVQGLPGVKYDQFGAPIFGQNNPLPTFETGLGITSLMNPKGYATGGLTGVTDVAQRVIDATNFDADAYLKAYPDVAAAVARGEFPNAFAHYTQYGQPEGRVAQDKTVNAAAAATRDAEKAAAQAANRKAVADAKAAKKAAGWGSAYQNINAGLSYDAPAGIAATAIAARQAAFKPVMDKFTQAQATNAATLAKPYTPITVEQPYNNTKGYENVFNPVVPKVNYDTTPVGTTQPPVTDYSDLPITTMPVELPITTTPPVTTTTPPVTTTTPPVTTTPTTGYTGPAITDAEVDAWLKANPTANDRRIAQEMQKFNVGTEQVARATGMQGLANSSPQSVQSRYDRATSNNPFDIGASDQAEAITGADIRGWLDQNKGASDAQIAAAMDKYRVNFGQMSAALAGTPDALSAQDVMARYIAAQKPAAPQKLLNMGGIASLGSGGYPRRTGQISGPGTETSDSIPAMLSDGEFVMTAKAVRGAGKGDKRAGAKRMYALMNQLEKNAARG